jgi:hypothetical protein
MVLDQDRPPLTKCVYIHILLHSIHSICLDYYHTSHLTFILYLALCNKLRECDQAVEFESEVGW